MSKSSAIARASGKRARSLLGIGAAIAAAVLSAGAVAVAAPSGDLLVQIDQANRVGDHFAFEMNVESFKDGKLKESNSIVGYTLLDEDRSIRSLIHFTAPKTVSGRKMLIEGNYIWAQFPKTRNLIRLTPLQILMGEVAYGDILRIVYSRDYDIAGQTDSTIDSGAVKVLGLRIKPERKGANYASIRLAVDARTLRLVQADIFGSGGKLIKVARFSQPAPFQGNNLNRRIEIRDATKAGQYSVLQYVRMGQVDVPRMYFTKNLLPKARLYDF